MAESINQAIKRLQFPDGNVYDIHALDADKLGAKDASEYALKTDINQFVAKGITFKGELKTAYTPKASTGDMYVVPNTDNLTINGITCDPGDMWICSANPDVNDGVVEAATEQNKDIINNSWSIVQANIDRQELDNTYAAYEHTHTWVEGAKTDSAGATEHPANSAPVEVESEETATTGHTHDFTADGHTHPAAFTNNITAVAEVEEVQYDKLTSVTFQEFSPSIASQSVTLDGVLTEEEHVHSLNASIPEIAPSGTVYLDHKHENVSLSGVTTVPENSFNHKHTLSTATINVVNSSDCFTLTGSIDENNSDTLVLSLSFHQEEMEEIILATGMNESSINGDKAATLSVSVTGTISSISDSSETNLSRNLSIGKIQNVPVVGVASATTHRHTIDNTTVTVTPNITLTAFTPKVATLNFQPTLATASTSTRSATVKFTEGTINATATTVLKAAITVDEVALEGKTKPTRVSVIGTFDASNIKVDLSHDHGLGRAVIAANKKSTT